MPKNEAWPKETSPLMPENRFQPSPSTAQIGTRVRMSW